MEIQYCNMNYKIVLFVAFQKYQNCQLQHEYTMEFLSVKKQIEI